jgi:hypothetical protein
VLSAVERSNRRSTETALADDRILLSSRLQPLPSGAMFSLYENLVITVKGVFKDPVHSTIEKYSKPRPTDLRDLSDDYIVVFLIVQQGNPQQQPKLLASNACTSPFGGNQPRLPVLLFFCHFANGLQALSHCTNQRFQARFGKQPRVLSADCLRWEHAQYGKGT